MRPSQRSLRMAYGQVLQKVHSGPVYLWYVYSVDCVWFPEQYLPSSLNHLPRKTVRNEKPFPNCFSAFDCGGETHALANFKVHGSGVGFGMFGSDVDSRPGFFFADAATGSGSSSTRRCSVCSIPV